MACAQAVQRPIGVRDHADLDQSSPFTTRTTVLIEADPHRIARPVELLVARLREHDVVHAPPRHRRGHELAHQQPRDRGVAVREVIDVGLGQLGGRLLGCRHRDARKSRIRVEPAVQRRQQVGRQPEEVAGPTSEVRDRVVGQTPVATQELRCRKSSRDSPRVPRRREASRGRRACSCTTRRSWRREAGEIGKSPMKASIGRPLRRSRGMSSATQSVGSPVTSRSVPNRSRSKKLARDRPSPGYSC